MIIPHIFQNFKCDFKNCSKSIVKTFIVKKICIIQFLLSIIITEVNNTILHKILTKEADYMKATGIVRKIDDLGRVVIPKEIRRTMRIREGDPLEIYTERDGEVIFKKYSPIGELGEFAANYAETLAKASGHGACITDRDSVIAVSGIPRKELLEKPISHELENLMNDRTSLLNKSNSQVAVTDSSSKYNAAVVVPIVSEGDIIGSVLFVMKDGEHASEVDDKLAESAAGFLGKHMES